MKADLRKETFEQGERNAFQLEDENTDLENYKQVEEEAIEQCLAFPGQRF